MDEALSRKGGHYRAPATYGNVAYQVDYAAAAQTLERGGAEVLRPQPRVRVRERVIARPKVAVREAGRVSVFAVVGFAAVGVFAALLLMSYVQLTVTGESMVQLERQMEGLEAEHGKLLAQYETAYDLGAIAAQVTAEGRMVKPQAGQIYTLDLSEADNVVHYGAEVAAEETGLIADVKGIFASLSAYFS